LGKPRLRAWDKDIRWQEEGRKPAVTKKEVQNSLALCLLRQLRAVLLFLTDYENHSDPVLGSGGFQAVRAAQPKENEKHIRQVSKLSSSSHGGHVGDCLGILKGVLLARYDICLLLGALPAPAYCDWDAAGKRPFGGRVARSRNTSSLPACGLPYRVGGFTSTCQNVKAEILRPVEAYSG